MSIQRGGQHSSAGFSCAMVAISDRTSGFKRPSQRVVGPPAPEEAPALAVPAQHDLGADQEEVASPVPVEVAEDEPEELITGAEAGPTLATEGDLELLAQEQILDEETLVAAEGAGEGGEEELEEFDHPGQDRVS